MKLELRHTAGLSQEDRAGIEEINDLIARGVDRFADVIKQAAARYMRLSEKAREKLKEHAIPGTAQFAAALERVAARELHPRLAMTNGWAARTLARLDYDTQERAVVHMIPVVIEDGKDHVLKPFDELTRDEIAQVFDSTTDPPALRDLAGQRAWQAAKKLDQRNQARRERATQLIVRKGRWRIQGRFFFPLKERFTVQDLEAILADMHRLRG